MTRKNATDIQHFTTSVPQNVSQLYPICVIKLNLEPVKNFLRISIVTRVIEIFKVTFIIIIVIIGIISFIVFTFILTATICTISLCLQHQIKVNLYAIKMHACTHVHVYMITNSVHVYKITRQCTSIWQQDKIWC